MDGRKKERRLGKGEGRRGKRGDYTSQIRDEKRSDTILRRKGGVGRGGVGWGGGVGWAWVGVGKEGEVELCTSFTSTKFHL